MQASTNPTHRVVIIGGGFAGLAAAKSLGRAPVEVTLIDRRNFHLFQPLLYQVATGGLSPANISSPLRAILKRQRNTRVWLADVQDFDVANKRVILSDGAVDYDTLILATGVSHQYFGNDHWEVAAPGLKTIEDATRIRREVLAAFEAAERASDPQAVADLLTFVVIGAGPTGVELAGALAEISRTTLKDNFRRIDPASARILLVEGGDRVLPSFPPDLSARAQQDLEHMGVEVRLNTKVIDVKEGEIKVLVDGAEALIRTYTLLWAAGVKASPLGEKLAAQTGAEVDRVGRVVVGPDCALPSHPEIFVAGDLAHFVQDGKPLPGLASVAKRQGHYIADVIERRLRGEPVTPYVYKDPGIMATIGRASAVADLHFTRLTGFLGWLAWLFIHLILIVEFQNRVLVMLQWAWTYLTRNRAARLITGRGYPFVEGVIDGDQ
jgi:NADH dehydrogenase